MMNSQKWLDLSVAIANEKEVLGTKVEIKRSKSAYEVYLSQPSKFCVTVLQPSNIRMNCIRILNEDERYSSWFNKFEAGKKYVFVFQGEEYVLKAHSQNKGRFDGCSKLFDKIGVKYRDKIVLINNFDGTYGIEVLATV